jgi:ElaB/YqjD/DUF883 family membrane-anchored ribosome-binding protein
MGKAHREGDKMEETAAASQGSGKCAGFEKFKNIIADKIHEAAKSLKEKATASEAPSGEPRYESHASEWLDRSAECVRQFDYEKANARIRDYVGRSPGASLLIAGGIGLFTGAIIRRR